MVFVVPMSTQNKNKRKIGISPKESPKLPEISDKDACKAQEELNLLLKREDITTNAVPSSEGDILTIFIEKIINIYLF